MRQRTLDIQDYWTGIADVTSPEMPINVHGVVYRVLTFAESSDIFAQKVSKVLSQAGDSLTKIEEPELLSDFLRHDWLDDEHEIFEMMIAANSQKNDVVCGEPEYYSLDESSND